MRYVDLSNVTIGEALRLEPRGGEVLAEGDTPVIWAHEGDGVRAVVVAFPLDQSDLSLRVAFPIFLSNALSWLGGAERIASAGDTVTIPSGSITEAIVTSPDGLSRRQAASDGRVVLPTIDRVGVYTVRVGDRELRLAVNPAAEESVIAPLSPRNGRSEAVVDDSERSRDAWRLFLTMALVVLLAEWMLWLRTLPRLPRWRRIPQVLRPRRSHG